MKKRLLSLFCALVLLFAFPPFAATADDLGEWDPPSSGGDSAAADYDYTLRTDDTVRINAYIGAGGDVVVPQTIDGHPVTAIGMMAFAYNERLRRIIIPEGVTTIGSGAFMECRNLGRIELPRTITAMDEGVFVNCSQLSVIQVDEACETLVVRDGVLFDAKKDVLLCFPPRRSDMTYAVPEGVRAIGIAAFSGMGGLEAVTLPESVERIGELAFWGCGALKSVTLPAALTTLAPSAFMGCQDLVTLALAEDNSALSLRDGVLFDKTGETLLCYPAGRPDTTYAVPEGTVEIAMAAFSACAALTEVTLPDTLETIASAAFAQCTSLRSLTIPAAVRYVDGSAFEECTALLRIDVSNDNPAYRSEDGVLFDKTEETLLCYPAGRPDTTCVVPEGTVTVSTLAFSNCMNLIAVLLPDTLETIELAAFNDCLNLSHVDIPPSVTAISVAAVNECPALVIYGWYASEAAYYAYEENIPFCPIGSLFLADVNWDDAVDTADAVLVLQSAAELIGDDALDIFAADVNDDGAVDTADAVLILQKAAKLIERFPIEG